MSPLLETLLVEVLTTGSLAPDQLLARLHVEDADGTLAFNRLAGTVIDRLIGLIVIVLQFGCSSDGSISEKGLKLISQEG